MTDTRSVRIATMNINGLPTFYHIKGAEEVLISHRARHKEICKWFEQSDIDVICFQEVFTYRNVHLLRKGLPSYQYVSYKPFIFGPRGALVIFSKFPITVAEYSSFSSTAGEIRRAHLPMLNILRSALKGILVVNFDSMPLTLVNTHLVYSGNGELDQAERFHAVHQAQLDLLGLKVKNHTGKNQLVVAGDLNVEVGERTAEFIKNTKLRDLFEGDDAPSFHNEFLADLKFKSRIDFLLTTNSPASSAYTQRIFTQRVAINGQKVYLSDHQGLTARLSV